MSEKKIIKLKFKDKEIEVEEFNTYQELVSFFQQYFSIDDDKKKKLILFYYDENGDKITFQVETDYDLFKYEENLPEKIIIGEIEEKEKEKEENSKEQDQMKSGTIFFKEVPEQNVDIGTKNLINYFSKNSLYSIDSINSPIILPQKSIKKEDNNDFLKGINQMKNVVNKTLEDNIKENKIEKMKKEMEEIIKAHKEELMKKEKENEKKYNDALLQKENEMKKQLEEKEKKLNEDRLKKENELKKKYENEMKNSLLIRQKELNEIKNKFEIEYKTKMEEIKKKKKTYLNKNKKIYHKIKIKKILTFNYIKKRKN